MNHLAFDILYDLESLGLFKIPNKVDIKIDSDAPEHKALIVPLKSTLPQKHWLTDADRNKIMSDNEQKKRQEEREQGHSEHYGGIEFNIDISDWPSEIKNAPDFAENVEGAINRMQAAGVSASEMKDTLLNLVKAMAKLNKRTIEVQTGGWNNAGDWPDSDWNLQWGSKRQVTADELRVPDEYRKANIRGESIVDRIRREMEENRRKKESPRNLEELQKDLKIRHKKYLEEKDRAENVDAKRRGVEGGNPYMDNIERNFNWIREQQKNFNLFHKSDNIPHQDFMRDSLLNVFHSWSVRLENTKTEAKKFNRESEEDVVLRVRLSRVEMYLFKIALLRSLDEPFYEEEKKLRDANQALEDLYLKRPDIVSKSKHSDSLQIAKSYLNAAIFRHEQKEVKKPKQVNHILNKIIGRKQ